LCWLTNFQPGIEPECSLPKPNFGTFPKPFGFKAQSYTPLQQGPFLYLQYNIKNYCLLTKNFVSFLDLACSFHRPGHINGCHVFWSIKDLSDGKNLFSIFYCKILVLCLRLSNDGSYALRQMSPFSIYFNGFCCPK
jgi:hypothetical protein